MKIIVAGSRHLIDYEKYSHKIIVEIGRQLITANVNNHKDVTIVSGTALGIDKIGEEIAEKFGFKIKKFKPDWTKYGKAAGPIRNKRMAEYADIAIVTWNGISPGSKNMIETMKKLNKPVIEIIV